MVYSVNNNSFQVTELVDKFLIPDYANALGTTALASPYNMFNGNPTLGTSVRLRYPERLQGFETITPDLTTQNNNIEIRYAFLNLNIEASAPFGFSTIQMDFFSFTADNAEFDSYYMDSAGLAMGYTVNKQVLEMCEMYWSDAIGDPQTPFSGQASLAQVDTQYANMGLNLINGGKDRYLGLHPSSVNSLQLAYPNYYNERTSTPIMHMGRTPFLYGMNIYEDIQMPLHTNGTFATSSEITVATTVPLTTTINDAYTTVSLSGFTPNASGVLNKGDLIYFYDPSGNPINSVNPLSYQPYNNAKKFYVMGQFSGGAIVNPIVADSSGNVTIAVYAPIVANQASAFFNVSEQVVAGSGVFLFGGANTVWRKGFAFDRKAFKFANPTLSTYPNPNTPPNSRYSAFPTEIIREFTVPETGLRISMNITAQGDLGNFTNQFVPRTYAGTLPYNGYGMTVAMAA
jgi:hypothetical protein